ncbi:MAG: type II toxin-antitoxin system RelE family toxin [Galactobacter sp.]
MTRWGLETTAKFDRGIRRLDRTVQLRIKEYLEEICSLDDPRVRGKALNGPLAGLWRYRVGDYRIEAEISDRRLVVVAVKVGHRSSVYR